MDRALRGVAASLIVMFVFLAWGILVSPASLLVKLVMFFMLSASAFGITLVMTTESPLADAVLKAPWEDDASADGEEGAGEPVPEEASRRPVRARARATARATGRTRGAEKAVASAATGQAQEAPERPAE